MILKSAICAAAPAGSPWSVFLEISLLMESRPDRSPVTVPDVCQRPCPAVAEIHTRSLTHKQLLAHADEIDTIQIQVTDKGYSTENSCVDRLCRWRRRMNDDGRARATRGKLRHLL